MKPVLISISGKSGVGKTTISNIISHCIGSFRCLILSTDDLHKYDRYNVAWNSTTHFNPKANNIELGDFHFSNLCKGKPIHRSIYNHDTGRFNPPKLISSKPFIINEGLHAYFSDTMKTLSDFKIYVDTDDKLTTLWKVNRDVKYRDKSESDVLKSIQKRKKDEHFIESQKQYADLIVKFYLDDDEVKLSVETIKHKNLIFDKIIGDLINYFDEISSLVKLSKKYGNNESYIQGPAGNISVKCLNNMLIKSSGVQLKDVDYFTGWSELDINYLTEYFSFSNKLDNSKYFYILNDSVQNNTVPSMESGMHSLLKKYVIHTHPNELITILCNKNVESILKDLYSNFLNYCYVPLMMPGLDLYEYIAKQKQIYDVYFLQNHGIIVTSDTEDKLDIHDSICYLAREYNSYRNTIISDNFGYITPDEYIFRESDAEWYSDMKKYYDTVKQSQNCNFISDEFLKILDNLQFEKHRKSL